VDMPAVSSERVVGRFGPGAPRDVMAQLLNGSHYDYVLLGSPSDPSALKRIVLTARPIGPEPASPPPNAAASAQNQPLQTVPEVENDQNGEDSFTPEVPPSDEDQAQPDQSQPDQSQSPPNGAPMVKTPEQLLREIEQQRQQQQNAQPPER